VFVVVCSWKDVVRIYDEQNDEGVENHFGIYQHTNTHTAHTQLLNHRNLTLTQHVHEKQLGDIPMAIMLLLLPYGRAYHCRFLGYDGSLLGRGFASADLPD
jgi:hypothetical protein